MKKKNIRQKENNNEDKERRKGWRIKKGERGDKIKLRDRGE